MTTRLGFRPRPVDINKELSIVRDESQLDTEEAFGSKDGGQHGADNKDQVHNEIKQKAEIIPVPPVTRVPTYETDYLPTHSITVSYIKQPLEPRETHEHEAHEYDLDVDDCQFLHDVNLGTQDRLQPRHLERMLYELEVLNDNATKNHAQAAGYTSIFSFWKEDSDCDVGGPPGERSATQPDATTEHVHKGEAMAVLARSCACQPYIRDRVFEFWKEKRKRAGKASLRRLQAPTPDSDNNPYHVFRQRAKPNKPQTRRRRETQEESLEKLRSIHDNLSQALAIAELVREREIKKTRLTNMQVDAGQYNLLRTMRERPLEELDKRLHAANKTAGRQRAFDPISLPKPGDHLRNRNSKNTAMGPPVSAQSERARLAVQRHKRQQNLGKTESLLTLPLPGAPPFPTMPFAQQDVLMHAQRQLAARHNSAQCSVAADELVQRMHGGGVRMRLGRCGRVLLDPHDEGLSSSSRANGVSGGPAEDRRAHGGGGENDAVNGVTSSEGQNASLQHSLRILMDKL